MTPVAKLKIIVCLIALSLLMGAKVVRYNSGAKKNTPATVRSAPSVEAKVEIDYTNASHVETLLRRIRLIDIRYYQKLMQAKQTNYTAMVDHLKKYWEEFNPEVLNQEKIRLTKRRNEVSTALQEKSSLYKKAVIKKEKLDSIHREFKALAIESCKLDLALLELQQKFSKVEIARLETQYEADKGRLKESVDSLFSQYQIPPDLSASQN